MLEHAKAKTLKETVLTALELQRIMDKDVIQFSDMNAATWYLAAMNARDFSLVDLRAIQGALRWPSRAGFGVSVVKYVVQRARDDFAARLSARERASA